MRCPSCNSQNPDTHRFCGSCGASLAVTCKSCGFENAPDSLFCGQCGRKLHEVPGGPDDKSVPESDAERRHLTVLFCDLAESTRLSRLLDPEDLRHLNIAYQKRCEEIIKRFDGYVARFMGDGVLAYFGYPHAHEDDVERAIRAGLSLIDAMGDLGRAVSLDQPLAARVGIATGVVVVGDPVGEGASQEMAVVGETPNLAARLQAAASPNTVLVSNEVRRLAEGRFEFEDLGLKPLKGFDDDPSVWRVLGDIETVSRFEATHRQELTPMVGREQELSLLTDCLVKAKRGEGQTALICGEPGIGKSRLLEALCQHNLAADCFMRRLQCSPLHMNSAFYPVVVCLTHTAGIDRADNDREKLDKLDAFLVRAGLSTDEAERAENVSVLAHLLGVTPDDRFPGLELGERELKRRTLELLSSLMLQGAKGGCSLVIVEDVHWADPTTLELLDWVVDLAPDHKCMTLLTYRPEFQAGWVGQAHVTLLTLSRMNARNCATLIGNVARETDLPPDVLSQIAEKTDGIPLFVEELTKAVMESGLAGAEFKDHPLRHGQSPLAIPDTLQDSLMARLDRLEPAKEVLHIGATIGREFSHDLMVAVAGQSDADLQRSLDKLLESQLVFRRGRAPDAVYIFKHALVRDIAYESILTSKRRLLHARVAHALEQDFPEVVQSDAALLAHHHQAAGANEKAFGYWRLAGNQAMAALGTEEAVTHYRNAVDLLDQLPDSEDKVDQELELRVALAKTYRLLDRYHEAHEVLQVAEEVAAAHDRKDHLATIHHCRGNIYFPQGRLDDCMAQHQKALSYALEIGSPQHEAQALSGLGDSYYLCCRMRTAEDYFAKCVAICEAEQLPRIEAANRMMLAWTAIFAGDIGLAIERSKKAVEFSRMHKHKRAEMIARQALCGAYFDHGNFDDAVGEADIVFEISRQLGAGRFLAFAHYQKACAVVWLGDKTAAEELIDDGLSESRASSHTFSGPCLLGFKGCLLPPGEARKALWDEADAMLAAGCPGHNHLRFYRDAIDQSVLDGDWDSVDVFCDKLEKVTREEPLSWSEFAIARGRLLARLGRGERSDALRTDLEKLAEECERLGQLRQLPSILNACATLK